MKLPKQWKHWCKTARLKPHSNRVVRGPWFYLQGRGHYWRVNCYGMFQRGDTYKDFDRWALCDVTEAPMPENLTKFLETVNTLLGRKS